MTTPATQDQQRAWELTRRCVEGNSTRAEWEAAIASALTTVRAEQAATDAARIVELEATLRAIAEHPHCQYHHPANGSGSYGTGAADGHRCAANIARAALTGAP